MARCPRCSHEFFARVELPVEPLYTLDVAAEIIPFTSVQALRRYLARHHAEWQKYYRPINHGKRRLLTRFLNAEQIKSLRAEVVRGTWRNPRRRDAALDAARQA